jgi:predicted heme/steroid binding protein
MRAGTQAEQVAKAAELGGILIDGRPQAERIAQSGSIYDQTAREHWEAGTHPTQVKASDVEATGRFSHIAETVDGIEQVPYWQLGGNGDESTSTRTAERTDGDGDEF